MVRAEHGRGMAGERHGNGMDAAWVRRAVCESAFIKDGNSSALTSFRQLLVHGRLHISGAMFSQDVIFYTNIAFP
jgi:hypothetical protein